VEGGGAGGGCRHVVAAAAENVEERQRQRLRLGGNGKDRRKIFDLQHTERTRGKKTLLNAKLEIILTFFQKKKNFARFLVNVFPHPIAFYEF
jgi:hypothetical protein